MQVDSIYLSRDDVERLTGKVRFSAQRRALEALRVRYDLAATGEPLVRKDAKVRAPTVYSDRNINWDAVNGLSSA